ncbi:TPA: hypothetical protein ACHWC7_004045 [Providencia stuartii]|uniref:hypothetical protein n=1 Tax=Proteus mirabilis TaxID=584 RepID=UPI000BA02CC3|nr:hypothetical protein [Proteus mirabilis]OZS64628.1 hypothetical protein CHI96_19015 [Proteus mirabilis]OZS65163.1 hypothetical protein CHI96_16300 [Proteus mirabilis]
MAIYFYNAFKAPQLLANDLNELRKKVKVWHNYRGDVTHEVKGAINFWLHHGSQKIEDIKEELNYFDLYLNPTVEEFQQKNKSVGLSKNTHLSQFIN